MVIESIAADPTLKGLTDRLATCGGVAHVSGLWGSSAPMVVALAASGSPRTHLYVTAHLEEADNTRDDLELFLGRACGLFPAWEALPGEGAASGEIHAERMRLCAELLTRQRLEDTAPESAIVVAPIQALMQPVPTPVSIEHNTLCITIGPDGQNRPSLTPETLLEWAIDRGFERLDMVESPGDVAQRGDIVDLFIPGENNPHRIQFFDEQVESIRRFDVSSQRSIEGLSSVRVSAMPVKAPPSDDTLTDLFTYLPPDTLVVLDRPGEIQELGETLRARLSGSDRLFSVQDVLTAANRFAQVHISPFGPTSTSEEDTFDFQVASATRFEEPAAGAVAELCRVARDHEVHVVCDNDGERQRLSEMIAEQAPGEAPSITLSIGVMHRGFEWTTTRTVVLSHHEIFHRHRHRRRIRRLHAGRPLETWMDLQAGDLVVHVVHGIAVYRGLKKMRKGRSEQQEEFLSLEFADQAIVHVPTSQIDLVQQYIGAGARKPPLSKLGGKRWGKTKQQVADSIAELAESLLRVQAVREQASGTSYPPDT